MRYYSALLILILLLFLRNETIACRCGDRSLDSHFKRSDVILKVKIISIADSTFEDKLEQKWYKESSESENRNFAPYREINHVNIAVIIGCYKGEYKFSDTVRVFSGVGSGDCGFLFEVGKEYIVFA